MTPPVFLAPAGCVLRAGEPLVLDGAEAHHAVNARRIAAGELIHVVDGEGLRAVAEVEDVHKDPARLELIILSADRDPAPDCRLVLVQALAKGGRDEAAIEMATEIGADAIIPWQADRSIARWAGPKADKRRQRWADIVRAAAKQSRRAFHPRVDEPLTSRQLADRVRTEPGTRWVILHEQDRTPISEVPLDGARTLAVIVGPEGGITAEELAALRAAGAQPAVLGPNVLRSSTAGPVALAHLAERTGRWLVVR